MKFVKFDAIGESGNKTEISINPSQVCLVIPTMIPGTMLGPGGKPVGKEGVVLDFGIKAIPVDCDEETAIKKLEEGGNFIMRKGIFIFDTNSNTVELKSIYYGKANPMHICYFVYRSRWGKFLQFYYVRGVELFKLIWRSIIS